ncbi:MAG: MinD/ParA family protein [bacterium]|nr:MinD/ParA family protein [bacterium]
MSACTSLKLAEATAKTVAVTGSKGGVGKSNLVLNLAVALGRWDHRVLLVDGDLGLANLDVLVGLMPRYTVDHLIQGEARLEEVLLDGPEGVRILPAGAGVPDLVQMNEERRATLFDGLSEGAGAADVVLVDTGAGIGPTTLALQLAASRVLVVTTPEPTSLVDAYATLKILWTVDPGKRVDLVVNRAADDDEARRIYKQIANAAAQFLDNRPGSLGAVYDDSHVTRAVRRQQPLLELFPDSPAARCYERIAMQISSTSAPRQPLRHYWEGLLAHTRKELRH